MIPIFSILYNTLFNYRIITIFNDGNLKYKNGMKIIYFADAPFSVINPIKEEYLLNKIKSYCKSNNLNWYYSKQINYEFKKGLKFKLLKKPTNYNNLQIQAIKEVENKLFILVTTKNNLEYNFLFVLDLENDKMIGYD